jgi:hypothetical protein
MSRSSLCARQELENKGAKENYRMELRRTVELYSKKIIGNYRKNSGTVEPLSGEQWN